MEGRPLSALINERKENVKYLPGVSLEGVRCTRARAEAGEGASGSVVCAPHEFVSGIVRQLQVNTADYSLSLSLSPPSPLLFSSA